jgi:pimeloyl-ACP methyl ester carboxylesterase
MTKPLNRLTLTDWVDSAVRDIRAKTDADIVLVGHSMAGLTVPRIAVELGDRVRHVVFVGATIPPQGQSMIDFTQVPTRWFLRTRFKRQVRKTDGAMTLPSFMARRIFCNDMGPADTAWVLDRIVPDSPSVCLEPVTRKGFTDSFPRTYVKMLRDKAVPPKHADNCIANIGARTVLEIDSGHDVMVSAPGALASILNRIHASVSIGRLHEGKSCSPPGTDAAQRGTGAAGRSAPPGA